jgi:hypothetical protein
VVAAAVALVGALAAVAVNRTILSVELAAVLALPAAWCGAAGALVSTTKGAPDPYKDGQLLPPEVAGMKLALRTAWPIIVALIGSLPVVAARRAATTGNAPVPVAIQAAIGAMLVAGMTAAWLRFREPARAWWKQFQEEGQQAAKERQAAKQGSRR